MNDTYLVHHGILGQKWGVRRYQNEDGTRTAAEKKRETRASHKEITNKKRELENKYYDQDPRSLKVQSYEKKADKLYDKYEFDGDDGGGGRTAADRKAGAKYMEYSEKIDRLNNEIDHDVKLRVGKELVDMYGQNRMNSYKFAENAKAGAAVVGVLAYTGALLTHPFATIGVTAGGLAIANNISKRKSKNNKSN